MYIHQKKQENNQVFLNATLFYYIIYVKDFHRHRAVNI